MLLSLSSEKVTEGAQVCAAVTGFSLETSKASSSALGLSALLGGHVWAVAWLWCLSAHAQAWGPGWSVCCSCYDVRADLPNIRLKFLGHAEGRL